MSEDSSSEEDVSKCKEAVDEKLTQAFNSNDSGMREKDCHERVSLPSLRNIKDNNSGDHRSVCVTPEFQKFVAKKLESALERYLDNRESDMKTKSKEKKRVSKIEGIKLFKSSTDLIQEFQEDTGTNVKKIKRSKNLTNSSGIYNEAEELEKARTVAVNPDEILSSKDTVAWCKDVKGEVMRVKKTSHHNEFSIEQNEYIPPEAWSGRVTR